MKKLIILALSLVVLGLVSTAQAASLSLSLSEGWALTLEKKPVFFPGSTRIALAVVFPVADGVSFTVKPRLRIGHDAFKPQPGLILGVGLKVSDTMTWLVGVLYEPVIDYNTGEMKHLVSPGTGPCFKLSKTISFSPSIAVGINAVGGTWSMAIVPVEFVFKL